MEVNPIAGGNRAKSGVADNLCGASKRGRCAANQSRGFRAGLHTMYVEAFAGAIAAVLGKGQSVFRLTSSALNQNPRIDFKSVAEAIQRFERWAPHSTFDVADHLLGDSGHLRDGIHGEFLFLALSLESF